MLHISVKLGETVEIDGIGYTLNEIDHLNNGARLSTSNNPESEHWLYIGSDGLPVADGAELVMTTLSTEFRSYAKLGLNSNRMLDVKFPS